ncbi:AAA ATPase [Mortierella polycephala]|uniref:AAA ATPase n=1 Tax=Mortierella polycephala TaxID=41804 RepID=A0A9P6U2G6_9FUNG|nr:AAA ATPase [Mortierella polycephala]
MSFLRKRSIAFSDDDDENTQVWPPTPSKRRSGLFNKQHSLNLSLKQSSIPAAPNFMGLRDSDEENQLAEKENDIRNIDNQGATAVDKSRPRAQTITPPLTPTRRSPRQSTKAPQEKEDVMSENCAPLNLSMNGNQQVPSTPKRRSRVLAPSSPSCASPTKGSSNTTGLTPLLNRILKPSKEVTSAVKGFKYTKAVKEEEEELDTVETRVKGYSTPKRLSRTRSCLELGNSTVLPDLKRTLSSNIVTSSSVSSSSSSASSTLGFYQDAKALFRRTTEPHRLVGRLKEKEIIQKFCQDHILSTKAGSLYISGQPGTGKTALLKEVMKDLEADMQATEHEIKVININCMTIKDPRLVYSKMLEALELSVPSGDKEAAVRAVEGLVLDSSGKTMYVTILDEVDQLLTKDQEVLYKLFQWSCMGNSRLTLIGIANALDMTDRFLPRLKAKDCEPQLLHFNPYQVAEIREIIMDRLFSLESATPKEEKCDKDMDGDKDVKPARPRMAPLMQRPAIELCARKVAAATGDLRKALDICRQTIEMVEMETKRKERMEGSLRGPEKTMPLQEINLADLENRMAGGARAPFSRVLSASSSSSPSPALSSPSPFVVSPGSPSGAGMTLQGAPKVTVEHVKRALASAFGSPMVQKMKALNVHQKLVLAVLVMKIQAGKTNDCEVGKIFDHYTAVCRGSNKISAVNRSEYQDLINMLEANGLITLAKAKEERLRKVSLVPRDSEALDAIKGLDIVDTILAKGGINCAN